MLGPGLGASVERADALLVGWVRGTVLPRVVRQIGAKYSVCFFDFGSHSRGQSIGCLSSLGLVSPQQTLPNFHQNKKELGMIRDHRTPLSMHQNETFKMETKTEGQRWSLFFSLRFHFDQKPSMLVGKNEC